MKFIISETDEILVSHSGLGLAGALLQGTGIQKRSNGIRLGDRKRPEVSHGDVVTAMIGLLCLGKPDFEDIEAFREDEFFRRALGLKKIPSEGTLRQRLDDLEHRCDAILREESAAMVARHAPKLTPCHEEWVALDIDPAPFDNSGTKKEGVSWTYLKFDGYAPWFAYLGKEGYLVHCQLREGNQHCQDGTPEFLDEAIDYARQITPAKLLVRMDAGNDDVENMRRCQKKQGGLDHQAEPPAGIAGGLAGGGPGLRRVRRTPGGQGGLDGRDLEGAGRQAVPGRVRGHRSGRSPPTAKVCWCRRSRRTPGGRA